MIEQLITGDEGEPTAEEREAIELLWRKGELLPFPWIVVDVSDEPTRTGGKMPPGTFVMLKSPAVWAREFAEDMNLDPSQQA